MPSIRESKIEDFAFEFLKSHYTERQKVSHLLVGKDEKTKLGTETDGLFAFLTAEGAVFTATIQMRNSHKLVSLLNNYKSRKINFGRLFATLTLFLISLAAVLYFRLGIAAYILPVVVALAGNILYSILETQILTNKMKQVVDELKKLPADEQWLGLSISSLSFRHNLMANRLQDMCKRRGIGIITVGKRAKVVLLLEPKTNACRKGDYLSYYASEAMYRNALSNKSVLRVA